jgi:hypothetical protein
MDSLFSPQEKDVRSNRIEVIRGLLVRFLDYPLPKTSTINKKEKL